MFKFNLSLKTVVRKKQEVFPGGPLVKDLPADAWYTGLIPGLGRFHSARDS